MTESSNLSPWTKHIAFKYHPKSYVDPKRLRIIYTRLEDQLADILTEPLPDGQFHILRKILNGWVIVTSICEGLLRYTKQLRFISVLVVLQLSKLFVVAFWNVHVLYVLWNVEFKRKHFEKTALMPLMLQLVDGTHDALPICREYHQARPS